MWASSHSRHAFKRLLNFERNSMFGIPLTATKHTSQSFWHIPRDPLASEEDIRGKFPGNSNIGFSILKILIFQVLGSRLVQVRFPETVGIQTFGGKQREPRWEKRIIVQEFDLEFNLKKKEEEGWKSHKYVGLYGLQLLRSLRVQLSHGLNYRKCPNRVKNNSHKGIFSEASKQRAALAQRHFRRTRQGQVGPVYALPRTTDRESAQHSAFLIRALAKRTPVRVVSADVTRKDPPNIWNLAPTSGLTSKTRIRKKDGTWRGTW
ncbi:predicted protein [Histoplasma capsulatum var. duboisii H88]|uniref:Predicted protein n=1 Tax=Ajellomyces capsulatus (strain H88) TaxID=544711 RepID=F0U4J0_AJEC8|nr:predicted protein [Histoplasma capsulatum var. duboisii H88]